MLTSLGCPWSEHIITHLHKKSFSPTYKLGLSVHSPQVKWFGFERMWSCLRLRSLRACGPARRVSMDPSEQCFVCRFIEPFCTHQCQPSKKLLFVHCIYVCTQSVQLSSAGVRSKCAVVDAIFHVQICYLTKKERNIGDLGFCSSWSLWKLSCLIEIWCSAEHQFSSKKTMFAHLLLLLAFRLTRLTACINQELPVILVHSRGLRWWFSPWWHLFASSLCSRLHEYQAPYSANSVG